MIYLLKNQPPASGERIDAPHDYATLVTHNTREFARVSGLRVEDWVEMSGGA